MKLATHPATGITATTTVWYAFRASITTHDDHLEAYNLPHGSEELLVLGMNATGDTGEKAIAWAMTERNRREEAKTIATAIAREGEAIATLARAISSSSEEGFIERLLPRLTENLRFAVKAQLR